MTKSLANPFAFPHPENAAGSGMTLRDWFAGMVLSSDLPAWDAQEPAEAAKWCYEVADAMLEERTKE